MLLSHWSAYVRARAACCNHFVMTKKPCKIQLVRKVYAEKKFERGAEKDVLQTLSATQAAGRPEQVLSGAPGALKCV